MPTTCWPGGGHADERPPPEALTQEALRLREKARIIRIQAEYSDDPRVISEERARASDLDRMAAALLAQAEARAAEQHPIQPASRDSP